MREGYESRQLAENMEDSGSICYYTALVGLKRNALQVGLRVFVLYRFESKTKP